MASVLGWQCIVPKGSLAAGGSCVFIPVDTEVDLREPSFAHLARGKAAPAGGSPWWLRIVVSCRRACGRAGEPCNTNAIQYKPVHAHAPAAAARPQTIKFGKFGVISEGIALPVPDAIGSGGTEAGRDISAEAPYASAVRKYEKDYSRAEAAAVSAEHAAKYAPFPNHLIGKSDEDNARSKPGALREFAGQEVYVSLKCDGSSVTVACVGGVVSVCSRNYLLLDHEHGAWQVVERSGLSGRLRALGRDVALQGEHVGPGLNGNRMLLSEPAYLVYTLRWLDSGSEAGLDELLAVCGGPLGVPTVPVLSRFVMTEATGLEALQAMADAATYAGGGGERVPGEGIVLRPTAPARSEVLRARLSVKMLSRNYMD